MPSQHTNLVRTVLHYLDGSKPESCALLVAGFHTGREIVRSFFEVATGAYTLPASDTEVGGRDTTGEEADSKEADADEVEGHLRAAEMFEIDVNGIRRPWEPVRTGETKDAAKRWCVVAVLVRR